MWGEYEYKFPQARVLYTYMYTHPGKKLNFMGNEIGHFRLYCQSLWDPFLNVICSDLEVFVPPNSSLSLFKTLSNIIGLSYKYSKVKFNWKKWKKTGSNSRIHWGWKSANSTDRWIGSKFLWWLPKRISWCRCCICKFFKWFQCHIFSPFLTEVILPYSNMLL